MIDITGFHLSSMVSSELTEYYIKNGFVLVNKLISKTSQDEIRTDLAKINQGHYDNSTIEPIDWPINDQRLIGRYMYIGQPHAYSQIIRQYIDHPKLCRILDLIVGANVPFWNGAYKCVQTMFVTKKPGGNGSPWHQDESAIPTRDRSLTGVWIALSDASTTNGCLWIIPDSHKSGIIYKREAHNLPDVDSMPIARGFDDSNAIPIEMTAGSVLFFSGYLLHNSRKNYSKQNRPALTIHYCSSNTMLPWGVNNYRGVTPIKGEDPYQSEGYTDPIPWAKLE
ncbi:phytanoyl-CoA dioxygenase [Candidatus Poribacteria bacterium]|nr:phytanoyl-CoA dioxygenase [Candidatus Poribacteria bacterium]MEE2911719.1 phytanoyl-CoA dioxygenase family protein [Candidatus Poribacteria bacterium]|tara:strand:+ start:67 stop:909 length:843 start_codon:yes stop_codon:yes gene_type:complete